MAKHAADDQAAQRAAREQEQARREQAAREAAQRAADYAKFKEEAERHRREEG
jgi:hypothetical protein